MIIKHMSISKYRSIENIDIEMTDVLQLIGKNNAGKSNILKAIDIFLTNNPSLSLQDFKNKNKHDEIEIIGIFNKLNNYDEKQFATYLIDKTVTIKLICKFDQKSDKIISYRLILTKIPKKDYLVDKNINNENIKKWFNENSLDTDFKKRVTEKTSILDWKNIVQNYKNTNSEKISYKKEYVQFNTELKELFKNNIPKCIFVPAVRDVLDETKVLQSNPFGKIIGHCLSLLSKKDKKSLMGKMQKFQNIFNGADRLIILKNLEADLNQAFSDLTDSASKLNICVQLPTYEDIVKHIQINVNENEQNYEIEHKGHGFQRYAIFSLLRTYAKYVKNIKTRSTIFLIEEPELYLHPQAQYKFLDILNKIGSNNDQVVYATHSNILIDLSNLEKMCVVMKNRYTTITQTTNKIIEKKLKLAYSETKHSSNIETELSSFCQPTATFGFFANIIILVEGYTEENSFPIYIKSYPELNNAGIVIINTHGIVHMPIYQIVYSAFGIPCFVIFDNDLDKPSKKHIAQNALCKLLTCEKDVPYPIINKNMCVFKNNYLDQIKKECKTYPKIIQNIPNEDRTNEPYIAKIIAQKTIKNEIDMLNSIKRIMAILSDKL